MTNLEITIQYLWTRFDNVEAGAASDTLTPYDVRRECIIYENRPLTVGTAKSIKPGQEVSIRLTRRGNPLLPLYFAPANSTWGKIPESVWASLRQKKSLAATTIGELFSELHASNKDKYPSEWYALGSPGESVSRAAVIKRIKRVFDYWGNTEYHLECAQSPDYLPTNFNQKLSAPDPRQLKCEYNGKRIEYTIEAHSHDNKNNASGVPVGSGKTQYIASKHPNTLSGYTDELKAEVANLTQLLSAAAIQMERRTKWANEFNRIIKLCEICNPSLVGENTVFRKATQAAAIVHETLTSKPLSYFRGIDAIEGLPGDSGRDLVRAVSVKATGVVRVDVSKEVDERTLLIYELLLRDSALRDTIYKYTVDTINSAAYTAAAPVIDRFVRVVCGALELLSELIQDPSRATPLNEALIRVPAVAINSASKVTKSRNAIEQSLQMVYAILLPTRANNARSDAEFSRLYKLPFTSNPGPPIEMLSLIATQTAAAWSLTSAAGLAHRGSDAEFKIIRANVLAAFKAHLPSNIHDAIKAAFDSNDEEKIQGALSVVEKLMGDSSPAQRRLATLLNIINFAFASKNISAGKKPVDFVTGLTMAGDVASYMELFEGIEKFDKMAKIGKSVGVPIKCITLFLDFVDAIKAIEVASKKRNNVGAVTGLMKATGSMFAIVLLCPAVACPVLGQVAAALVIGAAVVDLANDSFRCKTNLLLEALCDNIKQSDFYRVVSQNPEFPKLMTKISDLAYAENLPYAPREPATIAAARSAGFTDKELLYIIGPQSAGTNAVDGAGGPRQDIPSSYGGSGGAGGAPSY